MSGVQKFSDAEEQGRDKVIAYFNNINFTASEEPGDSWDLSGYTYKADCDPKPFLMEIKDRNERSDSYDTCYLEQKKLLYLKNTADFHGADMFYVCTYTDGVIYIFNLRKISITDVFFVERELPDITIVGNNNLVKKLVIELPFAKGKRFKINK